jgi:hypothetical protein
MRKSYYIQISGAAEPCRVRAEIVGAQGVLARSPWIELGAGQRRTAQVTLETPPGVYTARQVTNAGSNVHADLVSSNWARLSTTTAGRIEGPPSPRPPRGTAARSANAEGW